MTEYRAYVLDENDHFNGFEPLFCDTDHQAIAQARVLARRHGVELWAGPRPIVSLPKSDVPMTHEIHQGCTVPKPTTD